MTSLMRYLSVALLLTLVSIGTLAQTYSLQQTQFDSVRAITKRLRKDIKPFLNKRQAKIVAGITDSITQDLSFDVYSLSATKTINISKGVSDMIVKDIVADIISLPELEYVPGFHNLFMRLYPVLAPNVVPEVAAELTAEEKIRYEKIKRLPTFYSKYRNYLEFIYLHEVGHIVHDYDKQITSLTSKFKKGKISKVQMDSLLVHAELDADIFAMTMLNRLNRDVKQSFGVYRLMYFQKERRLNFISSILIRATSFYYELADVMQCHKRKDEKDCDEVLTKTADLLLYASFYPKFDPAKFQLTVDSTRSRKFTLSESVWMGNYYLLGTSYNLRNIEVAYGLFTNHNMSQEDIDALNAFKSPEDVDDLNAIEYTYFCAGKINELYFKDLPKAIEQFKAANEIALLMSSEYYLRTIKRLKEDLNALK